ncbi:hypothetical protein ABMA28_008644 [Loxostege sticticalis]|uniref:Uncharacterized protein n=1 Tax=Loxostege sticticalis TaxID=481309 RepID=A0ABD0SE74_LOXSC
MRWWVVLCVAVLWDTASLQPTKQNNGPDRECCPCPKDSAVDSSNTFETASLDQSPASSIARAAGCPCKFRSADAEGAPSAFLPAAVRAIRPFVSLDDSKEDPKPLLHPEVDLASSVLDTLREATNEEYEEALARDAARAAQEPDGMAAESAHNLVTVIMNPKESSQDDVMAEASHVHEARCVTPLGRSSLNLRAPAFDSPDLLSQILRLPKRKPPTFRAWNLFDMDNGASNVNEQVVEPMFKESDVETPKTSSMLRVSTDNNKPQSTLALRFPSLLNTMGCENSGVDPGDSILDRLRQSKKVPTKLELSPHISKLIPKLDTSHLFRKADDDVSLNTNAIDTDTRNSPRNFKLQIPHISTLIPKEKSSSLVRKTEEDKLSRTNNIRDDNRNSASTLIPSIAKLIPQISLSNLQGKSNDDALHSGMRSSENNLKPSVPRLKVTMQNNQIPSDDTIDSDSANSASTLQERYSSFAKANTNDCNDLASQNVETNKINDLKIPVVKSINLKNTENVGIEDNTQNKKIGLNLKVPDLNLARTKSRDSAADLVSNLLKGLQVPRLNHLISSDIFNLRNNDQASKSTEQKEVAEVKPNNQFETEILDTVPSPSQPQTNQVNIVDKEREDDISNRINEEMKNMIEEMPVKTEILDSIPKSSEISNIEDTEDPEINEDEIDNNDLMNAASEQIQKSKGEETSEFVNDIEEMNEDSIDDVIDNINVMDRENNAENSVEDFTDTVRDSIDDIVTDDFATENKVDGLAINSDIQSLSEKSVPETSDISNHDVLQPLRERIRQKLDSLKLAPKKAIDLPRLSVVEKVQKDQARSQSQNQDEATKEQDLDISNENFNQVNIEDLQRMSDSLLNQEKEHNAAVIEKNAKPEISDIESNLNDDVQTTDNTVSETNNINSASKVDKACIVNDTPNKNTELDITNDSKNNEMAAGASERVASIAGPESPLTNLGSPLRQSIILQPTSFGSNLNLYNRPVLDLNNFNNPLPGFKIPNLLKSSEGSNINIFSTNGDSLEDASPNSMSAQPSTSKFRSSLPSLQPLEDVNLDILQLKPLSADLPTLPRLNLNSFKTRLALPKSLDLKPVLLESSVGNKRGVIGATLTLGKDLDRSNLLQQASQSLKSSNILGQSLGTLPSLDDLHETLWENTQNLLSTPLETTGRNVVEDTLRSGQVLTDNLRVHAENAVKDLHQNLASTFGGAGLQSPGGLSSFRSSGDLLEEMARRHEDINDKLKGIHVDLSDRLESLRDNIFDQYRIPSLGSSLLGQSSFPSLGSALPKQSSIFRTSTKPSQNTLKSTKGKFVIPATKRKTSSRTSTDRNKLKTASSIANPKSIKLPELRAAPTESVFKTLRKEPSLKTSQFLSRDRPTLGKLQPEKNLIDFDMTFIKKPRLGQSKVKITFSTTPRPQSLMSKPSFGANSKLRGKPSSLKDLPTLSRSTSKDKIGLGSKLSSFRDASGLASEVIPSRVKAPLGNPSSLRTATVDSDNNILDTLSTTTMKPAITLSLTRPKSSLGTVSNSGIDRPALLKSKPLIPTGLGSKTENVLRSSDISKTPALSWPKKLDDEFLTKVREALRARLAEIGKKSVKPITESKLGKTEPTTDDMARSASNTIEVTDPQMMKENTSYTCKMTCTKNL